MGLFFILGLIFLFTPVLSGVLSFFILTFYKQTNVITKSCLFYLALLLGMINSLKVPESDLVNYKYFFDIIKNTNFYSYLFINGKEPLFFTFNYITYFLTSGSFKLYMIIFTTIAYYLFFLSIFKIHKKIKLSNNSFILSISIAFLFPNLFALSAHLMRQFLAASIVIYFLVTYVFYQRKNYLFLLASILTHTTSVLFAIVFIPFFKKSISLFKILYLSAFSVVVFLLIFVFSNQLLAIFEGVPVLSYLFKRVSNVEDAWETDNLGFINFFLLLFNVIVTYRASILDYSNKLLQPIFYLNLLLFLFVLINYNNTEIALRFSFYAYFLFPISFYFLPNIFTKKINLFFDKIIFIPIIIIFGFLFVSKLNSGTWSYLNLESLIYSYGTK